MNNTSGQPTRGFIRLAFSLLLIFSTSQPAATLETPHTADGSFSLELLAPAFQVQFESDGWISLQAEGFQSAGKPGEPALPRHHLQLALPPQADPASVWMEISNLKVERLPGTYHVRTIPPDSPGNTGTSGTTSSWTGESANASTFARLLSTGQMRKWRFANLEHAPFAFEPASGQLSLASRMLITIHYRLDPSATETVLLSDDLMDDLAQARFNNYEQAQVWYPPVEAPDQLEAAYDYVIVTTNAIQSGSSNLDDFILHKQALGYSVLAITESVYEELAGQSHNGTAEKIRQWLKDNYLTFGIKFVMLVGDPDPDDPSLEDTVGDVPMMMAWPRRSANDSYQNSPTDYFFADLTGDWDKDGDGYFGEWVEDQGTGGVDFAPEVYVGRIPVYSGDIATLDAVLQKIMDYENEDSPLSWRKQALLPMSFLAVGYDGAPLAEQMKADFLDAAGFSSWTQYQQGSGACSLDSNYASSENLRGGTVVRDHWSANDYGLVLWWGHGSESAAEVGYEPCLDGTLFDNAQTTSLDDDHPAFVYQNSSNNGSPENTNNLQYSLLKHGAVATVSATRVSWHNPYVGYGDFDGSTTNSGIGYEYARRLVAGQSAAEALYNAKSSLIDPEYNTRLMNFYDFNLYGDPSTYLVPPVGASAFNKSSPEDGSTGQPAALEISWQTASPVTHYEYCYDTSDDSACSNWTDNGLLTNASLSGLSQDTTYYWQVRAWNGHGAPTYADSNAWWHFSVGAESQSSKDYLPIVVRNSPPTENLNEDFPRGGGVGDVNSKPQ